MNGEQTLLLLVLAATVVGFLWGRWRHDLVAMASLLICVFLGLVPFGRAFSGFGHPAVITVALVLILSHGLQTSGAVDELTRRVLPRKSGPVWSITILTALAAAISGFMNNVGALALLMPVAIQIASRHELPPGKVLLPLSFGSLLGGMTTLIGTPPNIIVSDFRAAVAGRGFGMFDFAPVGVTVAVVGVAFVLLIGRHLVPTRQKTSADAFEIGAYLTEARVLEKGKAAGKTLLDLETAFRDADAQVLGIVHDDRRILVPSPMRRIEAGDILVIEADPEAMASVLSELGLKLEEEVKSKAETGGKTTETTPRTNQPEGPLATARQQAASDPGKVIQSEDVVLTELVVRPDSDLAGRSATSIRLRTRFSINLLAVSRQGTRSMARLRTMQLQAGDVLLMQGVPERIAEFAGEYGCIPLAPRPLRIPDQRKAFTAVALFAAAIALTVLSPVPVEVAFAGAAVAAVSLRIISLRSVYSAVDWSVVVLLAALIPVAETMATTGAADLVARLLLDGVARGSAIAALAVVLVVTMTLSDFMNNAATAALMCQIGIGTAARLDANPDAFLMAVAVGASCAFLTPIGHQNNTLILGPAGFRFGDYWRVGLPLEIIVVVTAVPTILLVWPL